MTGRTIQFPKPLRGRCRVCTPLLVPVKGEPSSMQFEQAMKEMVSLSGIAVTVPEAEATELVVRKLREAESEVLSYETPPVRDIDWLCFETEATATYCTYESSDDAAPSLEICESFTRLNLADMFAVHVSQILIAAHIAKPGAIRADALLLFTDDRHVETLPGIQGDFCMEVELSTETRWPPIRWLNIQAVWEWLTADDCFTDGFGRHRLGRAIAAFSYLATNLTLHPAIGLFWSLVGLEALYCEGNLGLAEQIDEKSQVLLGSRSEFKRLTKQMYDHRSTFIHGRMDFPSSFYSYDATKEFEQFALGTDRESTVSCALLIATLQEMSVRNLRKLRFSWALDS